MGKSNDEISQTPDRLILVQAHHHELTDGSTPKELPECVGHLDKSKRACQIEPGSIEPSDVSPPEGLVLRVTLLIHLNNWFDLPKSEELDG